jgi:hypothetical protein
VLGAVVRGERISAQDEVEGPDEEPNGQRVEP